MSQKQKMTTEEKLDVLMKAHEYREAGTAAEAQRITLELSMPTYLAKAVKEFFGAEALRKGGITCRKWMRNLDQIGLINDVITSAYNIDDGRKGFAVSGKERQGRISYESGIALAMSVFQEAQRSADPQTLIRAEVGFLSQELEFCAKGDTDTRNSLTYAIQRFRDALRSLEAVEDAVMYKSAEKTHPTDPKKRVQGFPKDAFHQACASHNTRLRNILRTPGIEMLEKAMLKQRAANMKTVQGAYAENHGPKLETAKRFGDKPVQRKALSR
jgi:hypothetical protein